MADDYQASESAVIGTILSFPAEAMTVCEDIGLRSDWFSDDGDAAIYEAAHRIYRDEDIEKADAVRLLETAKLIVKEKSWEKSKRGAGWLPNGVAGLQEKIDKGVNPGQLDWHIRAIRGAHFQRSYTKAFYTSIKTFAADPMGTFSMMIDKLTQFGGALAGRTERTKEEICKDLEHDEKEAYRMRVDPEGPRDLKWIPGFATPWVSLTRLLFGITGRLHVWAARPSVGKTSLAVNFMRFWADNKVKVCFNSLDMPMDDLVDRMRIEKSRVSMHKKIFTPTKDDIRRLEDASKWVCESSINIIEKYYVEDFCLDIVMKKKAGKIDIAMVDYVQLLNGYGCNNANEYERVSYVTKKLKETANRYKIPIIALCQLNRASAKDNNSEPGLADLRGSGELEQCASSVLILHRDMAVCEIMRLNPYYWFYANEQHGRDVAGQSLDAIWLIVAKNQNGTTGRLPFLVNKPYFAWKLANPYLPPEEHEEGVGATKRVVKDYHNNFKQIYRDWRGDDWEKSLEQKTVVIDGVATSPVLLEEKIA